jgi:hypothetical protein
MFARVRRFGNRRFVLGCLVVAALLGASAAVRHLWPVGPGVNPTNFRKIALGMPETEVEKLLGGPPISGPPIRQNSYLAGQPDTVRRQWAGDRCLITITFDDQLRVVASHCGQDTYVTKTQRWLAEQWSKTPQGRKAQVERVLSAPGLQEDPKTTLGELLDYMHDRYSIEFRINPADFGVEDA